MIRKFNFYKEKWGIESRNSIEPGIENVSRALRKVGNPHLDLNVIHVAGTNGKGSTIAMMNEMLLAHNLKTACFYSPCFVDVHDQIQINGVPISSPELDVLFGKVKKSGLSGILTDFELLTVLAFMAFKESNSDIILLETGMGGRFDSTNVITPMISVITSISLEHEQFLGSTLTEVAFHKAGIIKEGVPIVVGELNNEVLQVIKEESEQKKSPLWILDEDFSLNGTTYKDRESNNIPQISIGLRGIHQVLNAALAIRSIIYVLKSLKKVISDEKIRGAIQNISLPGRFEKIGENLYLDGAHNPASIRRLVDTIKEQFPKQKIHFVVGLLKGKNAKVILSILEEVDATFTFVDFPDERAMSAKELLKISHSDSKNMTKEPVEVIEKLILTKDMTLVTGSLYLIANLREKLDKIFKNI
ncbi:MAG: folylpolyglutamate synthase/dihydrofolate synthase family protein [Paenisporosarcina sp.]